MKKVLILKNQNHSRARFVYVFGKSGITGTVVHPLPGSLIINFKRHLKHINIVDKINYYGNVETDRVKNMSAVKMTGASL